MSRLCTVLIAAGCLGLSLPAAAAEPTPAVAEDDPGGIVDLVALMDANRDGIITRSEFSAHSSDEQQWFDLDINQDGVLDAEEHGHGITPRFRVRN